MRFQAAAVVLAIFALSALLYSDDTPVKKHKEGGFEVFPANTIEWKNGPSSLPKGAQIAVLEGDPTKEGPFVFRVKVPDAYRIPPHTHPKTNGPNAGQSEKACPP